ncbi:MAG: 3-deoxy-D-manno-octulosonic acid transferase [Candidatus Electrothrix sp. YB6]
MIPVYNFLLTVLGLLLLPLLLPVVLGRAKYRGRILERLGLKTERIREQLGSFGSRPVIWIHALSVGEVTSALPLARTLRRDMDSAVLVFTTATSSGRKIAESLIAPYADLVCSGPLDLRFAVRRYLAAIRPNLFILVETDFWPNWLDLLNRRNIPAMLVNGRISEKSFIRYTRFSFFFRPLFRCFALLSMQTAEDRRKMIALGVPADRVMTLGNLKYDMEPPVPERMNFTHSTLLEEKRIWVCGSTHPGEEELLFAAFRDRRNATSPSRDNSFLILAPRNIDRGDELVALARRFGLDASTRSSGAEHGNVLILNTLGELAACYRLADFAFVGGSLVREGGHNPIEPAIHGVPVLFGPHMEDFAEIALELVACGGAQAVTAESLTEAASALFADEKKRAVMGTAARNLVEQHRGGVLRHVQVIRELIGD